MTIQSPTFCIIVFQLLFGFSQPVQQNRAQHQLRVHRHLVVVRVVVAIHLATHPVQIPNQLHHKQNQPDEVVLDPTIIKMPKL